MSIQGDGAEERTIHEIAQWLKGEAEKLECRHDNVVEHHARARTLRDAAHMLEAGTWRDAYYARAKVGNLWIGPIMGRHKVQERYIEESDSPDGPFVRVESGREPTKPYYRDVTVATRG